MFLLSFLALAGVYADEASTNGLPPFAYYEVILNRKPFGDVAKPEAPAAKSAEEAQAALEQAKEEQALARQVDMVAVNRTPRGKIAVGFVDKGEKPPRNYYLNVGDSSGGFTVVAADFSEETATIEKDGVSITLKLGKGVVPKNDGDGATASVAAPEVAPPAQTPAPSAVPVRSLVRPGIRRLGPGAPDASGGLPGIRQGYASRLQKRNADNASRMQATADEVAKLRAEVQDVAKRSKEEAAQRERQINLELISKGQEPLSPIELTPEEDAKLVREGVLAPE